MSNLTFAGLHYGNCTTTYYSQIVSEMADILKEEVTKHPEKKVIFRSTPPQHFDGGGIAPIGYYQDDIEGQQCLDYPFGKELYANFCLKEIAKEYGFKYLNSAPIYMDRYDMHFPEHTKMDCSHFCHTPETYIPEIALINKLLE